MDNISILIICLASGILMKRTGLCTKQDAFVLNKLIIYFFIPLISLLHIPSLNFNPNLLWLSITPFLVFTLCYLFFNGIRKIVSIDRETTQALILTSGISSTSFVGFPIFEMLYGEIGLAYGVLLSLGGTILVFNTLGIGLLFYYSTQTTDPIYLIKRIFTFVPFLVFILSILLNIFNVNYSESVRNILEKLVAPFSVIVLITLGLQIEIKAIATYKVELILGQFFKLIIAPFGVYILFWHILKQKDTVAMVCILGSAIGSMNALSILTAAKGIKPELSVLMPSIGIPLSIPILFLIDYLIR